MVNQSNVIWRRMFMGIRIVSCSLSLIYIFNACTTKNESTTVVAAETVEAEPSPEPSTGFEFVDGAESTGINFDTEQSAFSPTMASNDSKLYAAWTEVYGLTYQIRVAVYNGDPTAAAWAFVDGDIVTGINKDITYTAEKPNLFSFNSKLYLTWVETNGTNRQIRVAVYGGDDTVPVWTFVDGNLTTGINRTTTEDANDPVFTEFNSKLYLTWNEATGASDIKQIRVAVYSGDDALPTWTFVDGNLAASGINKNPAYQADSGRLISFNSKLYATWRESTVNSTYQVRIAVYSGDDAAPTWTFVDGNAANIGLNKAPIYGASSPYPVVLDSKLYVAWTESNAASTQVRVAVFGGDDATPVWSFVDGDTAEGLNVDTNRNASRTKMTVYDTRLFLSWVELDENSVGHIRLSEYGGDDATPVWTSIDQGTTGGFNKDATKDADQMDIFSFDDQLFLSWMEIGLGTYQIRMSVGTPGFPATP